MKFNEIFLELRKEKGLTQLEIANKTGFAKNTVCAWEKGRAQPNFETLSQLSKIFNVTIDYLLGAESEYEFNSINRTVQTVNCKSFNNKERKLIDNFRKLSPTEQDVIIVQTKALADK